MRSGILAGLAIGASCFFGVSPLLATPCQSNIVDFTASGTFADASTLSGNLDIDIACNIVTGGNLSVSGGITETFTTEIGSGLFGANSTWQNVRFRSDDFNYNLTLDIDLSGQTNTTSLIGYAGGNLCTTADNCSVATGGFFISSYNQNLAQQPGQEVTSLGLSSQLASGTLSTGAAPEPSSFLLMGAPALWFGLRRLRRRA